MTNEKQNPRHRHLISNIAFVVLGMAVLGVSVVASVPAWRDAVRSRFSGPYREVLAKARGDLTGQGQIVSVIKLRTQEGIAIEIYELGHDNDTEKLMTRIKLDERRDGHFNIRGQATNLAMMDLDGDGLTEIIVPVYDENLIPRLHVFRFDPLGKVFIRMGPESIQL
jgi:hypothetical protein